MPYGTPDLFSWSAWEWEALLKLIIACVLGGALGLERELTRHPAGFRTHLLVSLGSCALLLLGLSLTPGASEGTATACSRVAQGVITGMGFIGAGAIIREGHDVRGITPAASLWVAAAVGLLVASGAVVLALFVTAIAVGILLVPLHPTHTKEKDP
jgi:putative Mg2+ transporter-C (MgtC) family protein